MTAANRLPDFASRLLDWFDVHGRHDLPWQHPRTPYRVWVSEIMLQQTQVSVVIDYFQRFMAAFPDIRTLAAADQDDVLAHWAGLGYYARGRNLHRAARLIVSEHGGQLPSDATRLQTLPGIGRSTAGAIESMGFGQRAAILDGNVKRLLARHAGICGWPGQASVAKQLWTQAQARLPEQRFADYSQALMDLGAGPCSRRAPACETCPVRADCIARETGQIHLIPTPKPRRHRPTRVTRIWLVTDADNRVLLQRRAPVGVWAGLWSLPEAGDAPSHPLPELTVRAATPLPIIRHELTHFRWHLQPLAVRVTSPARITDTDDLAWFRADDLPALPAPISALLSQTLTTQDHTT